MNEPVIAPDIRRKHLLASISDEWTSTASVAVIDQLLSKWSVATIRSDLEWLIAQEYPIEKKKAGSKLYFRRKTVG